MHYLQPAHCNERLLGLASERHGETQLESWKDEFRWRFIRQQEQRKEITWWLEAAGLVMWWLREERKCFNQFSALFQHRFYFLPQNYLDQNELSTNYNSSCFFHSQIPEVHWQPWMPLWLYLHFWVMPTLEYVCSSDFSCSTMSLPSL